MDEFITGTDALDLVLVGGNQQSRSDAFYQLAQWRISPDWPVKVKINDLGRVATHPVEGYKDTKHTYHAESLIKWLVIEGHITEVPEIVSREIRDKFYRMRDLQTDLDNTAIQAGEKQKIRAEIESIRGWFLSGDSETTERVKDEPGARLVCQDCTVSWQFELFDVMKNMNPVPDRNAPIYSAIKAQISIDSVFTKIDRSTGEAKWRTGDGEEKSISRSVMSKKICSLRKQLKKPAA